MIINKCKKCRGEGIFFQNTKQQIALSLMISSRKLCELNRPFSGCPKPLFESEANWEAIDMEMIFYSRAK